MAPCATLLLWKAPITIHPTDKSHSELPPNLAPPLSEELKTELTAQLDRYEQNPDKLLTLEQVKAVMAQRVEDYQRNPHDVMPWEQTLAEARAMLKNNQP